ncbi:MFS transporter [Paraburkholderia caribensis]|uniref:MFS transporter n=1 Tax=Paraburkholderia caribensis TaxID=75105 RepID=UPI001CAE7C30|nr:MFS transporter [Paraburkholderia caribensis]CAG9243776.1 Putative tartrate transporter [Paraburkholderia caribensis]
MDLSSAKFTSPAELIERQTMRKATVRLVWCLIVLYLLNVVDRSNVGFAALTMNKELGLTSQMFGMSVGIFYVGYILCEVPSNILFAKVGARRSLARMAVGSGLVTMMSALAHNPLSFYALRFLLGVAEAGYLPGIVLYLSYWFPSAYRARINALFMLAIPMSYVVSSAFAAPILSLDGTWGIPGWKWLFILEGLPAVAMGVFCLFYLTDSPAKAAWLTEEERNWLTSTLAAEAPVTSHSVAGMLRILANPIVLTSASVYFALNLGIVSLPYWLPSLARSYGLSTRDISIVTALPPLVGAIAMQFWGRISDRSQQRALHTGLALLVGAVGWAVSALSHNPFWALGGLVFAAIGIFSTYALSWTIPQTYLPKDVRPVAIAVVGVLGNIGGATIPVVVGRLHDATGSFMVGFLVISAGMLLAAVFSFRLHLIIGARRAT